MCPQIIRHLGIAFNQPWFKLTSLTTRSVNFSNLFHLRAWRQDQEPNNVLMTVTVFFFQLRLVACSSFYVDESSPISQLDWHVCGCECDKKWRTTTSLSTMCSITWKILMKCHQASIFSRSSPIKAMFFLYNQSSLSYYSWKLKNINNTYRFMFRSIY